VLLIQDVLKECNEGSVRSNGEKFGTWNELLTGKLFTYVVLLTQR
jgi:hypothetical protein